MITEIDKLRRLIAENKTDRALQTIKEGITAYPDLQNQFITLSAKFNDLRKKENIGLLDESEAFKFHSQVSFSLLELINEIENTNSSPATLDNAALPLPIKTIDENKKVFISYNHNDISIANTLKEKLTAENIQVVIDSEKMQGGDDIKEFIERCVRETGTTI